MQLTTINKIISYLLVGSLAASLLLFVNLDSVQSLAEKKITKDNTKLIGFIVPLVFLAVAAFLGIIIDSVTSLFVRLPLRNAIDKCEELIRNFFLLEKAFSEHDECKKLFCEAQDNSKGYIEVKSDIGVKRLAVGLLFHKSEADSTNWVLSHYATYILASCFLTITIVAGTYWLCSSCQVFSCPNWIYVFFGKVLIWLFILYSLTRFTISMKQYAYECVFRQAYIILKDSAQSSDEKVIVDA